MPSVHASTTTPRLTWLMVVVAPALILGIIGMHSLLVQPDDTMSMASVHAVATSPQHSAIPAEAASSGGTESGSMPMGCGGASGMCLAILIAVAAVWRARSGPTEAGPRRHRPVPAPVTIGHVRSALGALTPLQRTTVLRC